LSDPLGTASAAVTSRDGFRHGVQELLPAAPGIFAWGLVTGVAMVKSGLGVLEASVLSLLAYAGSAQLAALPLMMSAAPLWLIFLTATIVNLRFVVYSVMMRPQFAHLTRWRRLWLGAFLADIMFVKFSSLLQRHPEQTERVAYFFGGASANWVIWQVSSIAGILAATAIPTSWGLELAGTLTLIALIVPLCAQRPVLAGVLIAGTVSVLTHAWPLRLGLLAGILAGVLVAFLAERLTRRDPATDERGGQP
jgi:predicted branched-subunit amino acid permease